MNADRTEYPFLYETHLHTSQGSACGTETGAAMARAAKEAGYAGIFVTDHNWGGNSALERSLPWPEWVEQYCRGYEDAKREGDRIGLDVFFAMEAGFTGTEFLLYGMDKEWLLAHPELRECGIEEQYELVHRANGMVIHAHPFRDEWYIPEILLVPESVDGVEMINATHSHSRSQAHRNENFNRLAARYATRHGFPVTAGSDIHSTGMFHGGMAFRRRLTGVQDFISAVLSQEDCLLTDGERWMTNAPAEVAAYAAGAHVGTS